MPGAPGMAPMYGGGGARPPGPGPGGGHGEEDLPPKKKKERPPEKKLDISINSLLDILSVILVFLMKSYSTTSVQIKPSQDLQVPFSQSALLVEDSTAVTVTLKNLMVDDAPVLTLDGGKLADQDTSTGGLLIEPLFQKLQDEVAKQKKIEKKNPTAKFKGIVTIIADRYVPFPLITKIMYTAGQAEYSMFKFALVKSERPGG